MAAILSVSKTINTLYTLKFIRTFQAHFFFFAKNKIGYIHFYLISTNKPIDVELLMHCYFVHYPISIIILIDCFRMKFNFNLSPLNIRQQFLDI